MSRFKMTLTDGRVMHLDDVDPVAGFVRGIVRDSHDLVVVPASKVDKIETHRMGQPGVSFSKHDYGDGDNRKANY